VASGRYLFDIASLRAMGGWTADQGGTEIGDSCGDPQSIAAPKTGINTIWARAIRRDNGGCPGQTDANDCSGIVQNRGTSATCWSSSMGP
jgi:hypothetical protein